MITVNERYALEVDSHNYQLMEWRVIDPTKSPSWGNGKDKNGNDKDPAIQSKWVALGKYYPTSTTGLASALQEIAHREVREGLKDDISLSEYITELRNMYKHLQDTVEGAL